MSALPKWNISDLIKQLSDSPPEPLSSTETEFKIVSVNTPEIQLGTFGHLEHLPAERKVTDTFECNDGGVAVRVIPVADGDFMLLSGKLVVYTWVEDTQKGTWYGSEKRRREIEEEDRATMPVRPQQNPSYWAGQQRQVHGTCTGLDHPEGCRKRAIQEGFGCLLGDD